jgi:hypothetical protein
LIASIDRQTESGEVDFEDIDMKRLKNNIAMCLESLDFTKKLIEDYIRIFELTISDIGEDGNEVIRRHLEQGRKGLQSYLLIMQMI